MKILRKSKKVKLILLLDKWFGRYIFKLFLLANEIKAYNCMSKGSFVRGHYRNLEKQNPAW